jgi:hypothetical protein
MTRFPFVRACVVAVVTTALMSACSSTPDSTTTVPPGAGDSSLVINASTSTAYVTLGVPASSPSISDPGTSTAWDLSIGPDLTVAVNGGASGPGADQAYCLCANQSLTLTQVEALTATQGATAFDAITTASIPGDASFVSDSASAAIGGWYNYNATTHAITPSGTVYGIRLASTSGGYAKFRVTAIPSPGMSNAGLVTLQWAVEPTGSSALGPDQQATVDLSTGGKVYVNLTTGDTSSTVPAAWDIALQGYTISVNGGSSGSGDVAAVVLVPSSFYTSYDSITAIPFGATGIPSNAFTTDGAGGAFLSAPAYQYDPVSHQVYPTYNVYLVKQGSDVYKVQVTGYYNTGGVFGYITIRYAKLTP